MRNTLLKIGAASAGIVLALCLAAAVTFWFVTRPKPQKPWDTTALTSPEPPTFLAYGKERHIHLRYDLHNHTNRDYRCSNSHSVRVMGRYKDGSVTTPLENDTVSIEDSVFIPAQQTGMITLELESVISVAKDDKQTDEQYHEQLRALLDQVLGGLDGFSIFDEDNRYQINLPRWKREKPKSKPQTKP